MSSPIRTVFIGVGVIAVCLAMASLKGHHLLMAFAATGLLFGIRSWLHNANRPVVKSADDAMSDRRRPAPGVANVYQFPAAKNIWNVSDASGS